MLSSITPLGERGRQRRWGATVTAYAVGSVVAGSTLGALLGLVPAVPARAALVIVAVAAAVAAVADLRPALLPTVRRQVNEDWLGVYRGWVCGAGFGLQLGLGVVTIVTTAAVYVVLVAAAVSGSAAAGAVVGGTFGLARAVPALLLGRVTTTERLVSLSRRLDRWAVPARRTTVAVLCAVSAACAVAAVS
ncbi:MAG TPA: hypothetical protein VNA14_01570 [Mycobacteriales bacterium]|nr:hypothetical protein [Mycobacteriales bacterium]